MSAVVVPFPQRGPWRVEVRRETDGSGWLVLARSHGWVHGSLEAARKDARWLAANAGVAVAILTDMPPKEMRR
jgi:hypothetical protein